MFKMSSAFLFERPQGFIISLISLKEAFKKLSSLGYFKKSFLITMLTILSVHCAESLAAIKSSYGFSYSKKHLAYLYFSSKKFNIMFTFSFLFMCMYIPL